jgi:hypothetical protein
VACRGDRSATPGDRRTGRSTWRRRWRPVGGDAGTRDWSVGCRGPSAATSGTGRDWSVHPWWRRWRTGSAAMSDRWRRVASRGVVGGDGDWSRTGRSTRGGDAGDRRRCRGPLEDRSVAMSGDWSAATSGTGRRTGPPGGGALADWSAAMPGGTGRRTVGGDVGGLVGGDVGTGRDSRSTRGWRRWGLSAAMSGTG